VGAIIFQAISAFSEVVL